MIFITIYYYISVIVLCQLNAILSLPKEKHPRVLVLTTYHIVRRQRASIIIYMLVYYNTITMLIFLLRTDRINIVIHADPYRRCLLYYIIVVLYNKENI